MILFMQFEKESKLQMPKQVQDLVRANSSERPWSFSFNDFTVCPTLIISFEYKKYLSKASI